MSPKLPCLFCSSTTNQVEGFRYQGNKGQRDRVYHLLRDLLGIKLAPEEDFGSLEGEDTHLPLCVACALAFRNLSALHDQLLLTQDKVNSIVQEIRKKICVSEKDGSLAIALAIHSIPTPGRCTGKSSKGPSTAAFLEWIQKFREKVAEQDEVPLEAQNVLFVTGVHQMMEQQGGVGQGMSQVKVIHQGYSILPDDSATFFCVQNNAKPPTPAHHVEVDYQFVDDDQYPDIYGDSDSGQEDDSNENTKSAVTFRTTGRNRSPGRQNKSSPSPSKVKRKATSPFSSPTKKTKKGTTAVKKPAKKKLSTQDSPITTPKKPPRLTQEQMQFRKYKCNKCEWRFSKSYRLRAHLLQHSGIKRRGYNCDACKTSFSTSKAIQEHNLEVHGDRIPYSCVLCPVKRTTIQALESHMKIHDYTGPPWLCHICNDGKEFSQKINLKRHLLVTHNKTRSHSCPICSTKYSRKEDMMRHMSIKHRSVELEEGETFDCNLCSDKFLTSAELIAHLWSHGSGKSLTCRLCNIPFETKDQLVEHEEQIHGVEINRFPCPKCDLIFVTESLLTLHSKIHVPIPDRESQAVICEKCAKPFQSVGTLNRHVRNVHTLEKIEDRPFPCSQCVFRCKTKSDLNKHISRTHVDNTNSEKSRQKTKSNCDTDCKECGRKFSTTATLKRHMKTIHVKDNPRPFQCEYCNKTFKRRDDVFKHERNFHGIFSLTSKTGNVASPKPAKNPKSKPSRSKRPENKTTSESSTDEENQETSKPFECDICDARYAQNEDLAQHEHSAHGLVRPTAKVMTRSSLNKISTDRRVKVVITTLAPDEDKSSHRTTSRTIFAELDKPVTDSKRRPDIQKDPDWEPSSDSE